MKCQILFSGGNKKNINSLSSPELAQRVIKDKFCIRVFTIHNAGWLVCIDSCLSASARICCLKSPTIFLSRRLTLRTELYCICLC